MRRLEMKKTMDFIRGKEIAYEYCVKDERGQVAERHKALDGVDIDVKRGEFIAILGRNGSGKTTLARHINALLLPTEGEMEVAGRNTKDEFQLYEIRKLAGMVFQNPDNQMVGTMVEDEVAFGPENLGLDPEEIRRRVNFALKRAGMECHRMEPTGRLSGGQKQRIAIAGVLAMGSDCMILDEATSMLDPKGRQEVLRTVVELAREQQITIILITHDMEEAALADRILVMDSGKIVLQGTPGEVFRQEEKIRSLGLELPAALEFVRQLKNMAISLPEGIWMEGVPTENELAKMLKRVYDGGAEKDRAELSSGAETDRAEINSGAEKDRAELNSEAEKDRAELNSGAETDRTELNSETEIGETGTSGSGCGKITEAEISFRNVAFTYNPGTVYSKKAVNHIGFDIKKGEFTAIVGHTGSGKSTLAYLMGGLCVPDVGEIFLSGKNLTKAFKEKNLSRKWICRKIGLVFQYPERQLFEDDVLADAMFGPLNLGMTKGEAEEKARCALEITGVREDVYHKSPFMLSGGEKRRAALAGILAMEPEILLLDEPGAGLDPAGKRSLLRLLRDMNQKEGRTIVLISHSMEDAAAFADHLIVLKDGEVILDGPPAAVFQNRETLEEAGLTLPFPIRMVRLLRDEGIPAEEFREGERITLKEAAGKVARAMAQ